MILMLKTKKPSHWEGFILLIAYRSLLIIKKQRVQAYLLTC